jgi:hypothetical protein
MASFDRIGGLGEGLPCRIVRGVTRAPAMTPR